jgi:hypothetical protein
METEDKKSVAEVKPGAICGDKRHVCDSLYCLLVFVPGGMYWPLMQKVEDAILSSCNHRDMREKALAAMEPHVPQRRKQEFIDAEKLIPWPWIKTKSQS